LIDRVWLAYLLQVLLVLRRLVLFVAYLLQVLLVLLHLELLVADYLLQVLLVLRRLGSDHFCLDLV
jgi:hypothetical protein